MQPPPPLPGDRPGERRPHRLGVLGVLVLIVSLAVLAGIAVAAWILLSPKLANGGGGGGTSSAPLDIRPVTSTKPGVCPSGHPGVSGEDTPGGGAFCYRLGTGMTVTRVAEARAELPQGGGGWVITVSLNADDARRFTDLTRRYQHRRLALVTGGRVLAAPVVQEPITGGRVQIAGNFTGDEAKQIARKLGG